MLLTRSCSSTCNKFAFLDIINKISKLNFVAVQSLSSGDNRGKSGPKKGKNKVYSNTDYDEPDWLDRKNSIANDSPFIGRSRKPPTNYVTDNYRNNTEYNKIYYNSKKSKISPGQKSHQSATDEKVFSSSEDESDFGEIDRLEAPDWERMKLVKIKKNVYVANNETEGRSSQEINEFCSKNNISFDKGAPKPIFQFDELKLNGETLKILRDLDMEKCKPIQSFGLPMTLSGMNMIGIGYDGSGKLIASILTTLMHISHQTRRKSSEGPIAVILVSTDEMVDEVERIANQFCLSLGIKITKITGINRKPKNCDLLISTPDTLYDCLSEKTLNLHRCSLFTLNELDRLIELGFEDLIKEIVTQIQPECQRVAWSSKWNSDIRNFATVILEDFKRLAVSSLEVTIDRSCSINQKVTVCEESKKMSTFRDIIKSIKNEEKTIIFTETKEKANKLQKYLRQKGLTCDCLHVKKTKEMQSKSLDEYQNKNDIQYLILTDVVARNLKLDGVVNVINYDFPDIMSDYTCRINRIDSTIGSGSGIVHSIFTEENGLVADELISALKSANQPIDPALFILQAANIDSDDEFEYAVPHGNSFKKFKFDKKPK